MEAKFTKGKWYWEWDECDCKYPCDHGLYPTQLRSEMSNGDTKPVIYYVEDITSMDAHLIAAAPEMYDTLDSIENDDNQIPKFLWDKIQAVLAKARGENI